MIVVTGFGPFLDVETNPSGALARAVDGARVGRHTVVGLELPVSYERAVQETVSFAQRLRPALVLGLGVATNRTGVQVEHVAVNRTHPEHADVDGRRPKDLGPGPARVVSSVAPKLAQALGCEPSHDAGVYVCNAWLYGVTTSLATLPVAFVHIASDQALSAAELLAGLGRWQEME